MLDRLFLNSGEAKAPTADEVYSQRYVRLSAYSVQRGAIFDTYIQSGDSAGHDGIVQYNTVQNKGFIDKTLTNSSGEIYVFSRTPSTTTNETLNCISKFSSSFVLIWRKYYSAIEQFGDACFDSAQNLIIVGSKTGTSSPPYVVKKMDGDGNVTLSKELAIADASGNPFIVCDASDNIYVGCKINLSYLYSGVTKLNSSFVLQWSKRYSVNDASYYQNIAALFCDASGNVYVCQQGGNVQSPNIIKIASDGSVVAAKQLSLGTPFSTYPQQSNFCYDGNGGIYLTTSGVHDTYSYTATVMKIDTSLNAVWIKYYPTIIDTLSLYTSQGYADSTGLYVSFYGMSGDNAVLKINTDGSFGHGLVFSGSANMVGLNSESLMVAANSGNRSALVRLPKAGTCNYGSAAVEFSSLPLTAVAITSYNWGATTASAPVTITSSVTAYTSTPTTGGAVFTKFEEAAPTAAVQKAVFMSSYALGHMVADTVRGAGKRLLLNTTAAQATDAESVRAFSGKNIIVGTNLISTTQPPTELFATTFVKKAGFFDIVTYTGNGTAGRAIAHSLAAEVGCIMVKRLDATSNWSIYHVGTNAGVTPQNYVLRTTTAAAAADSTIWNNTAPTSSNFTVGSSTDVNANGGTYVAYLFANDTSENSLIKCGYYTGTGGTRFEKNLGWETQTIIAKNTTNVANWAWTGDMYAYGDFGATTYFPINDIFTTNSGGSGVIPSVNGFEVIGTSAVFNTSANNYIYIAIKNDIQKPANALEVFSTSYNGGSEDWNAQKISNHRKVDWLISNVYDGNTGNYYNVILDNRKHDNNGSDIGIFRTSGANVSSATHNVVMPFEGSNNWWSPDYIWSNSSNGSRQNHNFTRAIGVFDKGRYAGNGSTQTVKHNLGVIPEMIIFHANSTFNVYHKDLGPNSYFTLSSTGAVTAQTGFVGTLTNTTIGLNNILKNNTNGEQEHFYAFASLAGVSKVGSYVGNGAVRNVDCGFNGGARFVLVRPITSGAAYFQTYAFSNALGIAYSNDVLMVFTGSGSPISADAVLPSQNGFGLTGSSYLNQSGITYVYLAMA